MYVTSVLTLLVAGCYAQYYVPTISVARLTTPYQQQSTCAPLAQCRQHQSSNMTRCIGWLATQALNTSTPACYRQLMQITADRYRLDQAMKRAMGECVQQAKWEQPQCPAVFSVPATPNGSRPTRQVSSFSPMMPPFMFPSPPTDPCAEMMTYDYMCDGVYSYTCDVDQLCQACYMKSPLASAQAGLYEQYLRLTNSKSDCGRELVKITDMGGMYPYPMFAGAGMPMGSSPQSNSQAMPSNQGMPNNMQMQSNQIQQQRPF